MELVSKLEKIVLGWARNVPHLPVSAQKWLAENIWWITLTAAILTGITFLRGVAGIFSQVGRLNDPSNAYFVDDSFLEVALVASAISLFFVLIRGLLLAFAVTPLKERQKKGWVLLFMTLLVQALALAVSAVLTFSFVGFIILVLFGGILLGIGAYFLFEIHGQFSHPVKPNTKQTAKKD